MAGRVTSAGIELHQTHTHTHTHTERASRPLPVKSSLHAAAAVIDND